MSYNVSLNATMRGIVYQGVPFEMVVQDLPMPTIGSQTDAVVRITTSALCGSDLHVYRGVSGGIPPWNMGHEAVGYISEVGSTVSSLSVGDYVVIPDTANRGHLEMETTSMDFFGNGAVLSEGLQSEYARVQFADDNLIPIPLTPETTNGSIEHDYLTVSDIFGTAWTSLDYAGFEPGDTVAVFGAGPVGLLVAYSALLRGASRVYSVDHVQMRLERAASIGALPIDFTTDAVAQILEHESNGVMRSVDAVGMDAVNSDLEHEDGIVITQMISVTHIGGGIGIPGVYSTQENSPGAPLGSALSPNISISMSDFFSKGLSMRSGPVDSKLVAPELVSLISSGKAQPGFIRSAEISIEEAPKYYARFNRQEELKVYIHFD